MKRMFDKEEIVEIAKEEGGSVVVDSELSPTSENPVQNKVIYEALADKQDSLPDITGQTDKFLKVGSEGLEWAEAGGGKAYLHRFDISSATFSISGETIVLYGTFEIIADTPTHFTSLSEVRTYLKNKGSLSSLQLQSAWYAKTCEMKVVNGKLFNCQLFIDTQSTSSNTISVSYSIATITDGSLGSGGSGSNTSSTSVNINSGKYCVIPLQ